MMAEATAFNEHGKGQNNHNLLSFGSMEIDRSTRQVRVDQREILLTTAEFDLLWRLACRAGEAVTRDELYADILSREYDGLDRCIDLRVSRLRRKLGDNSRNPRLIKSVRYEGYLLVSE
jgi:DNA-binding response OmpR family regulator